MISIIFKTRKKYEPIMFIASMNKIIYSYNLNYGLTYFFSFLFLDKRLDTLHNEAQRKKTKEQFERILMLRNQEAFKCWFNKKSKSKWEWRNEQHKRKFN